MWVPFTDAAIPTLIEKVAMVGIRRDPQRIVTGLRMLRILAASIGRLRLSTRAWTSGSTAILIVACIVASKGETEH
ncbi:MAG TPA: hypothetical protein VLB07_02795 [Woeseiaceae bacterium]|nr:hypothetical protein [Woeseiaceae bacterium]